MTVTGQSSVPFPGFSFKAPKLLPDTLSCKLCGNSSLPAGYPCPSRSSYVSGVSSTCDVSTLNGNNQVMLGLENNRTPYPWVFLRFIAYDLPTATTLSQLSVSYGTMNTFATQQFVCNVITYTPGCVDCAVGQAEIVCAIGGNYSALAVGQNLTLILQAQLYTSLPSSDLISFRLPEIQPNSIRAFVTAPAAASLVTSSPVGSFVFFNVQFMGSMASMLTAFYHLNGTSALGENSSTCSNVVIVDQFVASGNGNNPFTMRCQTSTGVDGPYLFNILALNVMTPDVQNPTYNYSFSNPVLTGASVSSVVPGGCQPGVMPGTLINCPTAGGMEITITGKQFILGGAVGAIIGQKSCLSTNLVNSSTLICLLGPNVGGPLPVQVIIGGGYSGTLNLITFSAPTLLTISGCDPSLSTSTQVNGCVFAGNQTITISGTNLGQVQAQVFVGTMPCVNVRHDSFAPNSKVTCVTPPSIGGSGLTPLSVYLIQGNGFPSSNTLSLAYAGCGGGMVLNGTTCVNCTLGTYASSLMTMCLPCDAGLFASALGKPSSLLFLLLRSLFFRFL